MMSKKRRLMLLASMVLVLLSVISVTVFAEAEDVAAPASPFLHDVLVASAADNRNSIGVDNQGGLHIAVCWNSGRRTAVFQFQL